MKAGYMSPEEVAESIIDICSKKCKLRIFPMIILGMLAGVYIGFGAELCTMVTHDMSKYFGLGFTKFIGGSVFSVGLMLVVIGGAELFTGNCLMLIGPLTGRTSIKRMLRNLSIVYIANFAGSLLLVVIMYFSGIWKVGNLGVGVAALKIATGKTSITFLEALFRGIGCNWLVCLAVWLAIASKDLIGKIFGIYFPIMAFVASCFEHSIANMYLIPMGLFLKGNVDLVNAAGLAETINNLTWSNFIIRNLIPVTLGNIIGGSFFVAGAYYVVYLERKYRNI